MPSAYHFAVKTIGLSRCNGRKPCTLMEAARHNLREIQAERGAVGRIDAQRMDYNSVMTGPPTAAEVQALSDTLLMAVDTTRLKRDHVQAVEVVFSLPPGTTIDPGEYFTRCLQWLRDTLPMPVLLATVHHDEAAPHMHALMLPVVGGKHIGGALIDRAKLRGLRESFFTQVAGLAGLQRQGAKLRGQPKQWAAEAVVRTCESMGLPQSMGPLWAVFSASIERDPTPHMLALGIDVNTTRPTIEVPRPSPIALAQSPIALHELGQKTQGLSCVALHQQATQSEPPKAIHTLAELWAAVGCRSAWTAPTKAERLREARAAQQRAIDRHARPRQKPPAPALRVVDGDGWVRERDADAQDVSAWD
jgi:Plasmid recombination enzyme